MKRFKTFLNEIDNSLSISIDDITPSKTAEKMAKVIKKRLDGGEEFCDIFQDLTKTRVRSGALRIEVINALKAMKVDVKHFKDPKK